MELPVAIYEEITGITDLPSLAAGEADNERRKYRRVPFGCRATLWPIKKGVEGAASVVMVRDVSLGGFSFLHAESMKPGLAFLIEFKGQQDRPVKLHCQATRCEVGGSGGTQFVVGATFEKLLTKEAPPEIKTEESVSSSAKQETAKAGTKKNEQTKSEPAVPVAVAAVKDAAPEKAPDPVTADEQAPSEVDVIEWLSEADAVVELNPDDEIKFETEAETKAESTPVEEPKIDEAEAAQAQMRLRERLNKSNQDSQTPAAPLGPPPMPFAPASSPAPKGNIFSAKSAASASKPAPTPEPISAPAVVSASEPAPAPKPAPAPVASVLPPVVVAPSESHQAPEPELKSAPAPAPVLPEELLMSKVTPLDEAANHETAGEGSAARTHEVLLRVKAMLVKQTDALKNQQDQFKAQQEQLKTQETQLKAQDEQLKSQDEQLKTQEELLKSQEELVKTHEDQLRTQKDLLKTQETQLKTQKDQLKTQEDQAKTHQDQLTKAREAETALRNEVAALKREVTELHAKADAEDKAVAELESLLGTAANLAA